MNDSRLELDSHANMPVVGKYAYILLFTGQTADINTYNPQYEHMQNHIVDATVQCICPMREAGTKIKIRLKST